MSFQSNIAACAVAIVAGQAHADVTYQILTPAGQGGAAAYGLSSDLTSVGAVRPAASWHAAVWTSWSPAAVVDMHPAGATSSSILRKSGSQYVGNTNVETSARAALWTGPNAASYKSLHPPALASSNVFGTDGTNQIGQGVNTAGATRALLWSGTAASVVSLHPAGAAQSFARAIGGGRQVGWATFSPNFSTNVAGYWEGTAASWHALPVPAPFNSPSAFCISPDGQEIGGQAGGASITDWAVLWRDASHTFVSLNPAGYLGSGLSCTDGEYQCGYTLQSFVGLRAALWHGSSESFIDLSAALEPGKYGYSEADELRRVGDDLWIAGTAIQNGTNINDAILWHMTVPAPTTTAVLLGFPALSACSRRRRS